MFERIKFPNIQTSNSLDIKNKSNTVNEMQSLEMQKRLSYIYSELYLSYSGKKIIPSYFVVDFKAWKVNRNVWNYSKWLNYLKLNLTPSFNLMN